MGLTKAIALRRSTRAYTEKSLDLQIAINHA
jgi:hypothetical protein